MTEFRKGDVVTIRATVEYVHASSDGDRFISAKPDGHYQSIMLDSDKLTLVHRHFEPGQRVKCCGYVGTIVAINGVDAWVQYSSGEYGTDKLWALDSLPDEPEAVAA